MDMTVAEMLEIDQKFSEEIDYVIPTFSKALSYLTSTVAIDSIVHDKFIGEFCKREALDGDGIPLDYIPIFKYLAKIASDPLPLPIEFIRKALKESREFKYTKVADQSAPMLLTVRQVIQSTGQLAENRASLKDLTYRKHVRL